MIPYGRQQIDDEDVQAVLEVLHSDWLTTGPMVARFEQAFASSIGVSEAVAVNSGTAALHAAYAALGITTGDEVIVPALTFAATANAAVYLGAKPMFADVDLHTGLIDPESVASRITVRTKAIVAVDYAGQPCNYAALRALADRYDLALVADACHALGAQNGKRSVGSLADISTFSFHPVKPITTAEGGMATTDNPDLAKRMRRFRNHGIDTDHRERATKGTWAYEMVDLGFNYRLSDLQCALGLAQLSRLAAWTARRQEIAQRYDAEFFGLSSVRPLRHREGVTHAYHLYVVRLAGENMRSTLFYKLRASGIGANVHYLPVYLHPYYQHVHGTQPGLCPNAEELYRQILSLPIFPAMSNTDVEMVARQVVEIVH